MSEAVLAGLRELSGPELYRRNAFRVTGLPAGVDRRTVQRRKLERIPAARLGLVPVTVEEATAAFDVLADPRRRLVHEIFAGWGAPDGCGCPAVVHKEHDAAVTAHGAALDADPADLLDVTMSGQVPGDWSAAATAWARTLRSASFWRHLRHRVEELADRQLDVSIVDLLRDELPVALVRPLLRITASAPYPAPLRRSLSEWPVAAGELHRLVEEAAEPLYAELDSLLGDMHSRLDAGDVDEAVRNLREQVNPALARLEGIAPRDRHRRTSTVCNRMAVLLNNCALARYRETEQYDDEVQAWLAEAEKLATDPDTLRRIQDNRRAFDEHDVDEFTVRANAVWRDVDSDSDTGQVADLVRRFAWLVGVLLGLLLAFYPSLTQCDDSADARRGDLRPASSTSRAGTGHGDLVGPGQVAGVRRGEGEP